MTIKTVLTNEINELRKENAHLKRRLKFAKSREDELYAENLKHAQLFEGGHVGQGPSGWKLVPVEPTHDQIVNGVRAMRLFVTHNSVADFKLGYVAAMAAIGYDCAKHSLKSGDMLYTKPKEQT
jgi:hypothetical protein